MDTKEVEMSLDSVLEGFDLSDCERPQYSSKRRAVTIWLSPEMQKKYEELQVKSNKRFNKLLRTLIEKAIQKVNVPA